MIRCFERDDVHGVRGQASPLELHAQGNTKQAELFTRG
jgi:hypothetical protein